MSPDLAGLMNWGLKVNLKTRSKYCNTSIKRLFGLAATTKLSKYHSRYFCCLRCRSINHEIQHNKLKMSQFETFLQQNTKFKTSLTTNETCVFFSRQYLLSLVVVLSGIRCSQGHVCRHP